MSTNFQHEVTPLTTHDLESVPGVLGDISRERAADHAGKPVSTNLPSGLLRPSLFEALSTMNELSIIAEVKQKSPS